MMRPTGLDLSVLQFLGRRRWYPRNAATGTGSPLLLVRSSLARLESAGYVGQTKGRRSQITPVGLAVLGAESAMSAEYPMGDVVEFVILPCDGGWSCARRHADGLTVYGSGSTPAEALADVDNSERLLQAMHSGDEGDLTS